MTKKEIFIAIILSLIGLLVWLFISIKPDVTEAWDSIAFYLYGLPLLFLLCAVAGYLQPHRTWLWAISVFLLQPIALFFQSGGSLMIIAGLFYFAFFVCIAAGCAYVGSFLGKVSKHTKSI